MREFLIESAVLLHEGRMATNLRKLGRDTRTWTAPRFDRTAGV